MSDGLGARLACFGCCFGERVGGRMTGVMVATLAGDEADTMVAAPAAETCSRLQKTLFFGVYSMIHAVNLSFTA